MRKQKGIVLFFSLIVLIIMTVIGVGLAVNSNQSMKMAGAGAERIEASAIAIGALDKVIADNKGVTFANMTAETSSTIMGESQRILPLPDNGAIKDVGCQRSANASSANLISCRRVEISSSASFGRKNMGNLTVVAGVEQEVLAI